MGRPSTRYVVGSPQDLTFDYRRVWRCEQVFSSPIDQKTSLRRKKV
jgi:hypothetical protein